MFQKILAREYFFLSFVVAGFLLPGQVFAEDKGLVFVEVYSTTSCGNDTPIQETLYNILKKDDNIVFVNCRKPFNSEKLEEDRFSRQFCEDRVRGYFDRLRLFLLNTPMIIVNGVLEANNAEIQTAISAARTLAKVQNLDVVREGNALNIHIPAMSSTSGIGQVILYAYLPTQEGQEVTEVDSDVALDDVTKEKIKLGQSVPFVTKKRITPLIIRPVVSQEYIAKWTGGEMSFSVPIRSMDTFVRNDEELSFVAVLHDGDEFGQVLAAGEWKAPESVRSLPKEAEDIQQVSYPSAVTPQSK